MIEVCYGLVVWDWAAGFKIVLLTKAGGSDYEWLWQIGFCGFGFWVLDKRSTDF